MKLRTALLLVAFAVGTARADSGLLPLSTLIGDADVVVRATVASTTGGPAPGDILATLTVEQVFAGSYAGTIVVRGNSLDPAMHAFDDGEKILAFLVETPAGPGTHEAVGGVNGVAEIVPGTETGADGLVAAAVAAGSTFNLSQASPYLRMPTPAPRVLVSAALEDLRATAGPADHADIVAKACDTTGNELAATRLWALERIGALDPSGGRTCLRSILATATEGIRGGRRTLTPFESSALMALGTVGDPTETSPPAEEMLKLTLKDKTSDVSCKVPPAYLGEIALAVGRSGDDGLSSKLYRITKKYPELGVGSSVVHALGLLGTEKAERQLARIAEKHPEPLIRQQASATVMRSRAAR